MGYKEGNHFVFEERTVYVPSLNHQNKQFSLELQTLTLTVFIVTSISYVWLQVYGRCGRELLELNVSMAPITEVSSLSHTQKLRRDWIYHKFCTGSPGPSSVSRLQIRNVLLQA